jgi:IS1 family transposase
MRLPIEKATSILQLFVESMSIRSIERVSQVHHDTILRLLVLAGQRCEKLMDSTMRDLPCRRVQCDEIWTFVGKKARHVRKGDAAELGDARIFVAMDADTKLVLVFLIGKRSSENTQTFIRDLHKRTANRIQLTTDAFIFYRKAVEESFGADIVLRHWRGSYGLFLGERVELLRQQGDNYRRALGISDTYSGLYTGLSNDDLKVTTGHMVSKLQDLELDANKKEGRLGVELDNHKIRQEKYNASIEGCEQEVSIGNWWSPQAMPTAQGLPM